MQTDRFKNSRYINWVKVVLAQNYVKEGIEEFVDTQSDAFHKKLEASVRSHHPNAVTGASTPCHRRCHHTHIRKTRNNKWVLPCPSNICSAWLDELLVFSTHQLSPKLECSNTIPHLWPSRPWEVIKCFQPYGSHGSKGARDSDCTALMTIFTDCKYFENLVSNAGIAREVKEIRNKTMHSASQELEDSDVTAFIDALIDFLEDPVYLKQLVACQEAVEKIKQLRDGVLNMSLLKEAEQPILQQQSNTLATEIEQLKNQLIELKGEISESSESEHQMEDNIVVLQDRLTNLEDLKNRVELLETLESSNSYASQQDMQDVRKSVDKLNSSLEQQSRDIDSLNESLRWSCELQERQIESRVSSCRQYLIEHYDNEYTEVPIYPLIPDETMAFDDLYVEPRVTFESTNTGVQRMQSFASDTATTSLSYRDVLAASPGENNRNVTRNIYLVGDAGNGKTTYCQKMVRTWCKAHGDNGPKSDDEAYMLEFDLLFYVPLRYFSSHGKVETMIDELMEQDMSDVLKEARCLVILDGLDEWEPPADHNPSPYITKGLPNRVRSNHYTILTTTRSWKLEVVRPKKKEISLQVEICGVEKQTALATKLIDVLNDRKGETLEVEDFFKDMKECKIEHLMSTPINLIQLVCLWHDDEPIGNAQCAIYANMIDRQLHIAESIKDVPKYTDSTRQKLPSCFTDAKHCQKYRKMLIALGHLAYHGLFSENQESALVFSHSDLDLCNMSANDVEVCLKVGLLSQTKVFWKVSESSKRVSFIHKTHQEFLAAVYISANQRDSLDMSRISGMCTTVDEALEMSNLLLFVCGMNTSVGIRLLERILGVSSQDYRIVEYRQSCEAIKGKFEIVVEIQEMVVNIADEIYRNRQQDMRLPVIDLVLNRKSMNCSLFVKTEAVKSLYVDTTRFRTRHRDYLKRTLQELKYGGCLQKLHICDQEDVIQITDLQLLVLFSQKTLKSLCLEDIDFSELLASLFEKMFVHVQMTSRVIQLTNLALVNVTLTDEQGHLLLKCLRQMSKLQVLCIINRDLPERTCTDPETRMLDLSRSQDLRKLVLQNMDIDKLMLDTAKLAVYAIDSTIPDAVKSTFHCLHGAVNLQDLFVRRCRRPDVVQGMIQCLPGLLNLQRLHLYRVELISKSLLLSPDMKRLAVLSLEYAVFSSRSFEDMVDSFPSHEFCLELSCVVVKSDGDFCTAKEYLQRSEKIRCNLAGVSIILKRGNVSYSYQAVDVLQPEETAAPCGNYRISDCV